MVFRQREEFRYSGGKGKVILFYSKRNYVCLKPREFSQQKTFPINYLKVSFCFNK